MTIEPLGLVPAPGPAPTAAVRDGLVPRRQLVEGLVAHRSTPVVLLLAGPGYGKTTLLTQWAQADDRPFAWLTLGPRHNDPVVLLSELVAALHLVEPVDPEIRSKLASSAADFSSVQVPRLIHVLATRSSPFVLVLDDAHLLTAPSARSALASLCTAIPPGSQLALATREHLELPTGALRGQGKLLLLDTDHLAMGLDEGSQVLRASGLAANEDHTRSLVERTEGWPVALYLAALALREKPDLADAVRTFAGDDRFVVDYLRDELFGQISDETSEFLTRTAILDRLSGPLCDAVLERTGSAERLRALERANLLIVPLDRRREWFRYHRLLRDTLLTRLRDVEPGREATLHARASEWFEANGAADEAARHAARSENAARFDAVVWRFGLPMLATGRSATVRGWIDELPPDDLGSRPALITTAAWCALTVGDLAGLEHWTSVAIHVTPPGPLPDGTPFECMTLLLRAMLGQEGVMQMCRDAAASYRLDIHRGPLRVVACLLEGSGLRLLGDHAGAQPRLEEGVALGRLVNPASQAQCLAQLALTSIDQDDWGEARRQIDEALAVVDEFRLDERPAQVETYAVAALVHARLGASSDARRELKHSLWLLSMLTNIWPWIMVESSVLLARTALLLGDAPMALMLCKEAGTVLMRMPDAGSLTEQLGRVQKMCDAETIPLGVAAAPISPAEMRVLRYLPSHLTFAAIADELFVSRNTVKTQAISIYRKLGVSSRAMAVTVARELGLVEN